ncbi:MAG: HIT family protein [Deltaproteobacteria bacterium]|nr:HIT family protein [Deltaproteobacteria bacterium]
MNATAEKFGYPESLLTRFSHWLVLLRPAQPTLGSLVLVCTDDAAQFGGISPEAATELQQATAQIERALARAFANDKINYLMLMMVDPDVHFHVLPRYEGAREFGGASFEDASWPGPPDITARLPLDEAQHQELAAFLRGHFEADA